jgi:hypothetical protein
MARSSPGTYSHEQKYLWNLRSTVLAVGRATRPKATATARGEESSSSQLAHRLCTTHSQASKAPVQMRSQIRSPDVQTPYRSSLPHFQWRCAVRRLICETFSSRRDHHSFSLFLFLEEDLAGDLRAGGTTAQLMGASPFVPGWPGHKKKVKRTSDGRGQLSLISSTLLRLYAWHLVVGTNEQ